jgi:hypothetical protein
MEACASNENSLGVFQLSSKISLSHVYACGLQSSCTYFSVVVFLDLHG